MVLFQGKPLQTLIKTDTPAYGRASSLDLKRTWEMCLICKVVEKRPWTAERSGAKFAEVGRSLHPN